MRSSARFGSNQAFLITGHTLILEGLCRHCREGAPRAQKASDPGKHPAAGPDHEPPWQGGRRRGSPCLGCARLPATACCFPVAFLSPVPHNGAVEHLSTGTTPGTDGFRGPVQCAVVRAPDARQPPSGSATQNGSGRSTVRG